MNNTARFGAVLGTVIVLTLSGCSPPITNNQETPKNTCINNLRLIDGATALWALEHNKGGTNVPTWEDLKPYLCGTNNLPLPRCPSGGTYTLGSESNVPTCSIPGHTLH